MEVFTDLPVRQAFRHARRFRAGENAPKHHVEFLVQLVEHLPVVKIDVRLGLVGMAFAAFLQGVGDRVVIDLDKSHELLAHAAAESIHAHAADGHAGNGEFLVVRRLGQDAGSGKVQRIGGAGR